MYIKAARFVQDLRGLTPTEKAVAFMMAVHASQPPNFPDGEPAGLCTMSMALLARESGLANRETASRIVKRLVAIGIIAPVGGTVSKGGGHGEKARTTTYIFTMTVNPDSGVTKTSAAEERAARAVEDAKASVTQPSEPPTQNPENASECDPPVTHKPENDGQCDSPVTPKPENRTKSDEDAKASVTPQSHKGFPSGSFGDFSDSLRLDANDADGGSTARWEAARCGSGLRGDSQRRSAPTNASVASRKENNPVVVGETPFSSDSFSGECAPQAHPTSGRLAAPTSGVPLPYVLKSKAAQESQKKDAFGGGQEEQDDANDRLISELEQRQADRRLTNKQICDDFQVVFDRLRQQEIARTTYDMNRRIKVDGKWVANPAFNQAVLDTLPKGIDLEWTQPTPKQQKAAAEYFKAVGRDVAFANWEQFLLDGDHEVSQPLGFDEETGKSLGYETVQQTWLLYIFVTEQLDTVKATA